MSSLGGKVAVVTGASKGIGAGIAKALGAEGASVVVNYSTDREGADKVVAAIVASGGKAIAVQGSVAEEPDIERLFAETKKSYGKLDILVNNAGVFKMGPLESLEAAEFHRQFNTNVLGLLQATKAAVPLFGEAGGSVINISSAVTSLNFPGTSIYSATKGAVDTITRVLSKELGPKGIRVNAINPGGVETEGYAAMEGSQEMGKAMISMTPLGRMGQPDDIAKVAVFLASGASEWLTGEILVVSGGLR